MARLLMTILAIFLFLSLLIFPNKAQILVFDVTKHGAKANGADISQALTSVWKQACSSTSPSKVVIPRGIFSLQPVILRGPCKAAIKVKVKGILKSLADSKKRTDTWVKFQYLNQFKLYGGGTFDGQGAKAWSTCQGSSYCKHLPINIRFDFVTNGMARDITSLDSQQFHVNVLGCKNFSFVGFNVIAPAESPNTDGIHIGRSNGVKIINSQFQTGDDCISIGDGSQQISITNVTCGPGHGISVGSLGKFENEEPVVGVTIRNCTFKNTANGVRIKTWPASFKGLVSDIHYEDITMVNVSNPIVVDQVYCPWNKCNPKLPSRIELNNISFKNIRGTSATPVATKLACSSGVPCQSVEIVDIDLKYNGKDGPPISQCSNVKPKIFGKQNPPACSSSVSSFVAA